MHPARLAPRIRKPGPRPPTEGANTIRRDELAFDARGARRAVRVLVARVEQRQKGEHGVEHAGRVDEEGFGEGFHRDVPEEGVEVGEGGDGSGGGFGQGVEGRACGCGVGDDSVDEGGSGGGDVGGDGEEGGFGGHVAVEGVDGSVDLDMCWYV